MDKNKQLDKIRGSLVGGAVGDALGYPVEFIGSYMGIKQKYGEHTIGHNPMVVTRWRQKQQGMGF